MTTFPRIRLAGLAVTAVAAATLLTGCSANAGGDTTCSEFLSQDSGEQRDTITEFLESEGESTQGATVNAVLAGVNGYCHTAGDSDTKIKDIDQAGTEQIQELLDMFG